MASLLTFTGCGNDNSKSQDTIRKFLTAYYTVDQSDYDYYIKIMSGAKGGVNVSDAAEYQQAFEENNKKFQQYLTDKSYKAFIANRLSILRIQKPYNNNVFTEIKDLEISIYRDDKTAKTIGYHYEMKLNQINKDTKKIETVNRSGNLTVIKEYGYWKIVDEISR